MANLWEHIDLCSGIGGFSLGFQLAELSEPILFCELDDFCQKILKKHWPDVKICNDVKELADDTTKFIPRPRGRKRILTAGYPCQPFSQAGQRRGTEDPRHIWPYILRIIQQERPDVLVFENVAGHISLGLDEVLHDLQGANYQTRVYVLPAEACGAPHRRDRLWIIARNMGNANDNESYTTKIRRSNEEIARGSQKGENKTKQFAGTSGRENHDDVSNANSIGWDEERYENGNTQKDSNQKTEGGEYQRGSSYVADTNGERLQGSEETRNIGEGRTDSSKFSTRHGGKSNVAYPNHDGHERGQLETRDQTIARQDTQGIRATNSDNSIGLCDDGRDFEKSRTDETLSRLPNDGATTASTSEGVRGVSEVTDNHQGVSSQDRHKENDNRTLVQEGQSRFQSSIDRGLGEDQTSFENDQIRQGDDNSREQGMAEQGQDVADPNSRMRRGGRTIRQSGEDGNRGLHHTKEEQATNDIRSKAIGCDPMGRKTEDVADSNSQRGCGGQTRDKDAEDAGQSSRGKGSGRGDTKRRLGGMVDGLSKWLDEPLDIPRVATGQKNRVHRLKALGNAVVPQICQRIGIAIKESF